MVETGLLHIHIIMAILSVCLSAAKQLMLAVGDSGGTLHILEVPWSLSHPSTSEVSSFPYLLSYTHTHTHTLVVP